MNHESDQELVSRCQRELPYVTSGFEILVRRHQALVLHACEKYLRNYADAEEACQDAFLRVFHGLNKFEAESSFRTWLYRIVANACADRYRRGNQERSLRVPYRTETMEPTATEASSTEMNAASPEFGRLDGPIGAALDTLGEDDRQILVLRHIAELSIRELSETLEIGESAAKMRLYRAEHRLRQAYQRIDSGRDKNRSSSN